MYRYPSPPRMSRRRLTVREPARVHGPAGA